MNEFLTGYFNNIVAFSLNWEFTVLAVCLPFLMFCFSKHIPGMACAGGYNWRFLLYTYLFAFMVVPFILAMLI